MLSYVHTRVWQMYSTLDVKNIKKTLGTPQKKPLAAIDPGKQLSGSFILSQRQKGELERAGHDIYPALDIHFDPKSLIDINRVFFSEIKLLQLSDLLIRINDIGFLQVLAILDIANPATGFKAIENAGVLVTRAINSLLETIKSLFSVLEQMKVIRRASDLHFGVPAILAELDGFDWTDTYLYSDHVLLATESEAMLQEYLGNGDNNANRLDFDGGISVYNPWSTPLWVSPQPIALLDWLYLLAGENLLLSESLCYSAGTHCYQVMLETFFCADTSAKEKVSWATLKPSNLFKREEKNRELSSKTLLKLIIRSKVMLQKVVARRPVLDNAQGNYFNCCREHFPLEENRNLFRDGEKTLHLAIQERETEEKEQRNGAIEAILFFFTGLTVYSVIVDLNSFFLKEENPMYDLSITSPRIRLVIMATVLIGFLYLLLRRCRKCS